MTLTRMTQDERTRKSADDSTILLAKIHGLRRKNRYPSSFGRLISQFYPKIQKIFFRKTRQDYYHYIYNEWYILLTMLSENEIQVEKARYANIILAHTGTYSLQELMSKPIHFLQNHARKFDPSLTPVDSSFKVAHINVILSKTNAYTFSELAGKDQAFLKDNACRLTIRNPYHTTQEANDEVRKLLGMERR
jgi:hypothetical protein